MNIAVLCGGLSSERDVSISSGTGIARALREKGHKVLLMDVFFGYTGQYDSVNELFSSDAAIDTYKVAEREPDLEVVRRSRNQDNDSLIGDNVIEICRAADIVFLALHGEEGENGKLQAALDIAGIRYTGSGYLGSAIAMNKQLTKKILAASGIAVPGGITVKRGEGSCKNVGFPCVVKPCSGGSSVGTSVVTDSEEYEKALDAAFEYEESALVEQYIKGRELTVGVMDGEAMPVIEIIPKTGFYDYRNKYQAGFTEELCPAPLTAAETEEIQCLAEQVCRELMIEAYCRVDFLMDESGRFVCLEANTLPGMTPTSLIPQMAGEQGIDFGGLCEKIIEKSLKKYQ